jgi:hypothetical protein
MASLLEVHMSSGVVRRYIPGEPLLRAAGWWNHSGHRRKSRDSLSSARSPLPFANVRFIQKLGGSSGLPSAGHNDGRLVALSSSERRHNACVLKNPIGTPNPALSSCMLLAELSLASGSAQCAVNAFVMKHDEAEKLTDTITQTHTCWTVTRIFSNPPSAHSSHTASQLRHLYQYIY